MPEVSERRQGWRECRACQRPGAQVARARETTRQVSPAPALVVSSPGVMSLEQRGRPVPGPGEVLIQPAAVGLCGTDLDILAGRIDPAYVRYPLVLGHEWSGTVLASGSGVAAAGHPGGGRGHRAVRSLRRLPGRPDQPLRDLRRDGVHPGRGRGRLRGGRLRPWCIRWRPR